MNILNKETALNNAGGDEAFLLELAQMFVEDAQLEIEGLQAATLVHNAEKIRFHAHTLKGMSGNLGGEALHAICLQAEEAGRIEDFPSAEALLPQVQAALADFSAQLRNICGL